ncbi:MAG: Rrf2 family transcriptional regulator [Candidatus Sumerlaeia bacterium]|nr:Rrf2 family transcriptional regulator [Candidatus Sumerlaeia bacterium]
MKLSRKTEYALQALLLLGSATKNGSPAGAPLSVRQLAEEHGLPRKFLETIMRDLRSIGVVESIAGKNGGYQLRLLPREITLLQIIRCFDSSLLEVEGDAPEGEEEFSGETGGMDPHSGEAVERVRRTILTISEQLDQLLDSTTLEDILNDRPIQYMITNRAEFAFGEGI